MWPLRKDFDRDEIGTKGYCEWVSQNSVRKAGLAPCLPLLSLLTELNEEFCGDQPIALRARGGLAKWAGAGLLYFHHKAQAA